MKTNNTTSVGELLRQRYLDGQITFSQAAEEFCKAGIDKLVDLKATRLRFNFTPEERANCTPMPYSIIARVDWSEYKCQLKEIIKETEKCEAMYDPDDERNPYTLALIELKDVLHWVDTFQYAKVAEYEYNEFGWEAFRYCIIPPKDYVSTIDGVKDFVSMLVEQFKIYDYYPDDSFCYTDEPEPGKTFISDDDAYWLTGVAALCKTICEEKGEYYYDIVFDTLMYAINLDGKFAKV